jgi:pyruvate dehydrogenase complex dehydrogenase (E1) component
MKAASTPDFPLIERITRRAFAHMVAMIHVANNRDDADKTDPKVGGHPAACASSLDFIAALHLVVREPGDFVCCKPHARRSTTRCTTRWACSATTPTAAGSTRPKRKR